MLGYTVELCKLNQTTPARDTAGKLRPPLEVIDTVEGTVREVRDSFTPDVVGTTNIGVNTTPAYSPRDVKFIRVYFEDEVILFVVHRITEYIRSRGRVIFNCAEQKVGT